MTTGATIVVGVILVFGLIQILKALVFGPDGSSPAIAISAFVGGSLVKPLNSFFERCFGVDGAATRS
jgi:hypothetical protein